MSSPSPVTAKPDPDVGSYFVSNYPPFVHWSAEQLPEALEVLDRAPVPGTPLGLYVHVPFCRKRCRFCYFKVYTETPAAEVRSYVEALGQEAALYAARAFVGGRRPGFVYFGGGTPSYLSGDQLRELFATVRAVFPWGDEAEVTFECEPGTLRQAKVDALRELGVTRLSLGVESFTDALLELNGRAHGERHIEPAYQMCRDAGFPQINIDLIAGMIGETEESWAFNLQRLLELRPDSVTIYQMEVPYNTGIYRAIRSGEELGGSLADAATRRRWTDEAFQTLQDNGYALSSGYTAVRIDSASRFVYRDSLWRGADMVGLGVSAFGHLGGVHLQNDKDLPAYLARVGRGELPLQRGFVLTPEQRLVRELVLQLKLGRVEPRYFLEKFGVDVRERFAPELSALAQRGLVSSTPEWISLSREGLLQVDRLLHGFFLPEHREPERGSNDVGRA